MMKVIPQPTLTRLPIYLNFIKQLDINTLPYISAGKIASELLLSEIQVRKDLSSISCNGRPKKGFETVQLIKDIEHALGYDNINDAILIGAGKMGTALLSYPGFRTAGIHIISGFDNDESKHGITDCGIHILPVQMLPNLCMRMHIRIAILTVPPSEAQTVTDILIRSGIKAIWNFTSVHLETPTTVFVKNENLESSIALLLNQLPQNNNKYSEVKEID